MHAWFRPYKEASDDKLASICQLQIFFALLASVVNAFDEATLRVNYNMDVLLTIFTVVPLVAAVATLPLDTSISCLCRRVKVWVVIPLLLTSNQ